MRLGTINLEMTNYIWEDNPMLPHPFKADEVTGNYKVEHSPSSEEILKMANYLAQKGLRKGNEISSPAKTHSYLQTLLQELEHEVFGMICLDQKHRIIRYDELFRGTINSAQVYPRELIKIALQCNSAAVILFHNHPSGNPQPSTSDKQITRQIQETLALIDIKTLDHLIVGSEGYVSLAEAGFI